MEFLTAGGAERLNREDTKARGNAKRISRSKSPVDKDAKEQRRKEFPCKDAKYFSQRALRSSGAAIVLLLDNLHNLANPRVLAS